MRLYVQKQQRVLRRMNDNCDVPYEADAFPTQRQDSNRDGSDQSYHSIEL